MKASEHFRILKRGIGLLYELSPTYTAFSMLEAVVSAVTPYVPIWFSARLVDAVADGAPAKTLAVYAALTAGLTFLLGAFAAWLSGRRGVGNEEMYVNADWRYAAKAMDMAYSSIEDRDTALLRERIQNETRTGYNYYFLQSCLTGFIRCTAQIIASAALTVSFFFIDSIRLWMKLALTAGILLTVIVSAFFRSRVEKMQNRLFEDLVYVNLQANRLSEYKTDYMAGKDVRLYGMAEGIGKRYLALNEATLRRYFVSSEITGTFMTFPGKVLEQVLRFAVYMLLIFAALRGGVSVGSIARYVSCIALLMAAVLGLVDSVQRTLVNDKYLKRYFSYFDIPNEMYKGSLTVEKRDDNEYDVEFKDVSFRYPNTQAWALRHVNLKFKVGEKLAVVGMNGSGKTTFIKLLCRLYDPTEGVILLNSVDIRKYDYDEYMSLFSVVFQDFKLFAVSLGQNVAADTDYDRERVNACLARAGFERREGTLPKGLDTPLYKDYDKDGVEISGGEAQKIALARALYKDAPFIILDEPTAALDPVSEYEVYSHFNSIAGDKTAVYISHRLASCRFCDKIAVFDAGRIVQTGRHEELLAAGGGKYCELWNAQAQYFHAGKEPVTPGLYYMR